MGTRQDSAEKREDSWRKPGKNHGGTRQEPWKEPGKNHGRNQAEFMEVTRQDSWREPGKTHGGNQAGLIEGAKLDLWREPDWTHAGNKVGLMEGNKQDTSGNHEGFLGETSQIPLQYFRRGRTYGGAAVKIHGRIHREP